jgi:hypothetical protein
MPQVLLLNCDGTYELQTHKKVDYKVYQKLVGGSFQYLPFVKESRGGFANLKAVTNESGMIEQLPTNPWSFMLRALGFLVPMTLGGVSGPVALIPERGAVPKPIVNLCAELKEAELEDGEVSDEDNPKRDVEEILEKFVEASMKGKKKVVREKKKRDPESPDMNSPRKRRRQSPDASASQMQPTRILLTFTTPLPKKGSAE